MLIHILQQCPENLSALCKGGLCPLRLSSSRNPNDLVDIFDRGGLDSVAEHPSIGRTVAHNQLMVPFLRSRLAVSSRTRKRNLNERISSQRSGLLTHPTSLILQYHFLQPLSLVPCLDRSTLAHFGWDRDIENDRRLSPALEVEVPHVYRDKGDQRDSDVRGVLCRPGRRVGLQKSAQRGRNVGCQTIHGGNCAIGQLESVGRVKGVLGDFVFAIRR